MTTLICYNYLPVLADYVFDLPINNYLKHGITPLHKYPILNNSSYLKEGDKIFVKTDLLHFFLINIFPNIQTKFYLITGVSDFEIDNKYLSYLNDDKIIKWIGVNISIPSHPKVCKMLIGFQEPDRKRNGSAEGEGGDQELLYEMYNIKKQFNDKLNKLFISYLGNTHSSRGDIHTTFNNVSYIDFGEKMNFENYLNKINDYKFVLCPRGNGIDTHRFCEILLMGSVPIVERNGMSDLYEKFPCIIVDHFNSITFELLQKFMFNIEKYNLFKTYIFTDKLHLNI
jgi:hypothetical protein